MRDQELQQLLAQKNAIEQRIRQLTDGTSVHPNTKLAFIASKGPQADTWAVFYKYRYIGWHGKDRTWRNAEKWVPFFSKRTREEAIAGIPEVIKDLQKLYDELTEKGRPADTGTAPDQTYRNHSTSKEE